MIVADVLTGFDEAGADAFTIKQAERITLTPGISGEHSSKLKFILVLLPAQALGNISHYASLVPRKSPQKTTDQEKATVGWMRYEGLPGARSYWP
ncbi:MAG: hypothetical protein ACT4OT_08670 [Acidobacteriota bacterium]